MRTKEIEELARTAEGVEPEAVEAARRFLAASSLDESHGLLAARTLAWLAHGVESLDRSAAKEALASAATEEALTAIIERLVIESSEQSPLIRARLRGARRRLELLDAEGGRVSAEEAAGRLGKSRAALDKRRSRGTVLALPKGGEYVYPEWQFDEDTRDGLLPGLRKVLADFGVESPWMRAEFLLAHHEELGGMRPIDALKAGEVHKVQGLAASYGEQGAR